KVLAFVRRSEQEQVLVVANLSRHAQYAELDLASLRESRPVEMFGGTWFPPIGERPYLLTLGPHSFYWFELRPPRGSVAPSTPAAEELPRLTSEAAWTDLFEGVTNAHGLESVLPHFLAARGWLNEPQRAVTALEIMDAAPVPYESGFAHFVLIRVEYGEGDAEIAALPLAFATG